MLKFKDLMERINIAKTKMGDVIKDFQDSDAPQFKGKSMEKRRQMAIAAKLEADRGVKEEVEDLEEISKTLATNYMNKAADSLRKSSYGSKTNSKRNKGIGNAHEKIRPGTKSKVPATNEEVEQIDELETATLKSYRTKARAQGNAIVDKMKMGGGDWSKDQKDTKTLRKRAAGAQMSGKKLVKRGESLKTEDVEQTDEELKGNQHKIDANKNGKIDGHDFKILRNAKKARYQ